MSIMATSAGSASPTRSATELPSKPLGGRRGFFGRNAQNGQAEPPPPAAAVGELSQFQKDKFAYLFYQFYDVDRNGVITHGDFKETLKTLRRLRNWKLSDKRFAECEYVTRHAWNALRTADTDKDNKVTLEEWQTYWADFVKKSHGPTAVNGWPPDVPWVKDYMNFWFDLMDTTGDGSIDEEEYAEVCSHYGVPKDSAKNCFQKFSAGGQVDRNRFSELWLQYMTSANKEDPGNFVFGNDKWN